MWALIVVTVTVVCFFWGYPRSRLTFFEYWFLPVTHVYARMWHRWAVRGRMPLPAHGPALLVSNHSSSSDPPILLAAARRSLSFIASREHYELNGLFHYIQVNLRNVPVRRDGRDPVAARQSLRRLAEGRLVVVFPESNLAGVARRRLRPGKHGAAFLALVSGVPVYPVYIAGGPQTHRLLRAWLLPSVKPVRLHFGPAVDLSAYRGRPRTRAVLEEVTQLLMRRIESLKPSPRTGGKSDEPGNRVRTDAQALPAV
jgi:1-acyl-sn-glycerol-3-phosphate acyltransferase